MNSLEQMGLEEKGFNVDAAIVLDNKKKITDFFTENREWYEELKKGGSTFSKVGLETQEAYDTDIINDDRVEDIAPLDENRINQGRAESIAKFFEVSPAAKAALLEYLSH